MWIILIAVRKQEVKKEIRKVSSIAHCDEDGKLMLFDSYWDAASYRHKKAVNGQLVQLEIR